MPKTTVKEKLPAHRRPWFRVWISARVCGRTNALSATANTWISDMEFHSPRTSQRLAITGGTDPREILTTTPTGRSVCLPASPHFLPC